MGLNKIQERHRPGALKQQNKAHKHGRHRSKGAVEKESKGKVSVSHSSSRVRKLIGRDGRRRLADQRRKTKRDEVLQKKRALGGSKTPPFLVAVVPLSSQVNIIDAMEVIQRADSEALITCSAVKTIHISIPRFKQRFSFIEVSPGDLYATLDALKVADTVLFLETAINWEEGLCPEGQLLLSAAMAQGLPSTIVAVTDLDSVPKKKQQEAKLILQKEICQFLPDEKILSLSSDSDPLLIFRRIGSQKQRSLVQRDRHPHLLAENLHFTVCEEGSDYGTLRLSGYLRGQVLSANDLIHIPGWGSYQMERIEAPSNDPHPLDFNRKREIDSAAIDGDLKILDVADPRLQEGLESENISDPMDAEQTWPTEEEIAEAKAEQSKKKKNIKKIPKGFSDYQAAWIPDIDAEAEVSQDESEDECGDACADIVEFPMSEDDSSERSSADDDNFDIVSESAPDADMYDAKMDLHEEHETLKKLKEAQAEAAFPDEVDTPHNMPAKIRFQKYRGLQSFRTSEWDTKENLPSDYAKIFQFENFNRTRKRVLRESESRSGAMAGWYITLVIKDVPKDIVESHGACRPLVVYGLLPYEQKMSVLNFVLKRPAQMVFGLQTPIKSKEQLVFQCGFRRFKACPIFSQHTNGTKHKFERYFHPDAVVVATVFAPIMYPPCSVLAFKERKDGTQQLVATGSVFSVNPDRIVAKRVVLSGHPFKVHKHSAVIRYMFFNREDINWFKPVELRTKHGRRGHIKEPLGTHGHMKCVFDGQLKSQDTVLLNLYKRVFPKWTYDTCVRSPRPLFKQALGSLPETNEDENME